MGGLCFPSVISDSSSPRWFALLVLTKTTIQKKTTQVCAAAVCLDYHNRAPA